MSALITLKSFIFIKLEQFRTQMIPIKCLNFELFSCSILDSLQLIRKNIKYELNDISRDVCLALLTETIKRKSILGTSMIS